MEIFSIKFVPFNIPFDERVQTAAVACWFVTVMILPFISFFCTVYLYLGTNYYHVAVLYVMWVVYDRQCAHQGGRRYTL